MYEHSGYAYNISKTFFQTGSFSRGGEALLLVTDLVTRWLGMQTSHCKIDWHGHPQKVFQGGATSTSCLSFLGFWRCIANICLRCALPIPLHKENTPSYGNSKKIRFLRWYGSNIQVYCDNTHNNLSADFQNRALLYKEALPWSSMKSQILTLFCLARIVSVTSKQELQTFGNSLTNQN